MTCQATLRGHEFLTCYWDVSHHYERPSECRCGVRKDDWLTTQLATAQREIARLEQEHKDFTEEVIAEETELYRRERKLAKTLKTARCERDEAQAACVARDEVLTTLINTVLHTPMCGCDHEQRDPSCLVGKARLALASIRAVRDGTG